MAITLRQSDADFEERFAAFLTTKREVLGRTSTPRCARSSHACAREGDAALIDYTLKFDRADLRALGIAVSRDDIAEAYDDADAGDGRGAEVRARPHPLASRAAEARRTTAIPMPLGVELGSRWTAIEAVGLYVPGGTASYPSSVLMNAVPAKVAGVERIVMVVPAPGGVINPLVLVAADLAGVVRDLPRRRRAGDRGACLWHRDDPRRSPRSSGPAMPMSPPPSARCSARSAST